MGLGWDACFLIWGGCDPFNDKALQAGRGAAFKLPMEMGTWKTLAQILKLHRMQCYGASPDKGHADSTIPRGQQPDMFQPLCVILGSEGQGLSERSKVNSIPLAIPMSGTMESLNVAQAGAILMFALGGRTAELYSQLE